jgi:hypothetical protein
MKKLKLIITLLLLIVFAYSCNDDYLDEVNYGTVNDGVLWKDKSDFQQAINSAVSNIDQTFGYGTIFSFLMEDAATDYWIGGANFAGEFSNFSQWKTSFPNNFEWGLWPPVWNSIYYSNLVLERMDKFPVRIGTEFETGDLSDKKRFEGQARFFRAMNYYFLQNKFGGVPIITSVEDKRTAIPQSTREEVRILIENDLILAANLLPGKADVKSEGQLSRPSKQAALGLLARLYINWESRSDRWQKTTETCNLVINDPSGAGLETPYSKIFALDNENNKEILFALEHSTISNQTGVFLLNTFFASEWDMQTPNASRIGWGGDWRVSKDLIYDKFETNDLRRNQLLMSYTRKNGTTATLTTPLLAKYPLDSFNLTNFSGGNDQPIIRYADIILMKAEALNQDNNLAGAITLVNDIRHRAGLGDLGSPHTNSKADLNDYIYHERRREFFCEGLGRTDMIRFKKFLKWVNEKNGGDKNIDADSKYLVYPFDGQALRKNTGLKQNPGYLN